MLIKRKTLISKYWKKHYVVEEANLYEFACSHCKGTFAADWKLFRYVERDDGSFAKVHCPYCGTLNLRCV